MDPFVVFLCVVLAAILSPVTYYCGERVYAKHMNAQRFAKPAIDKAFVKRSLLNDQNQIKHPNDLSCMLCNKANHHTQHAYMEYWWGKWCVRTWKGANDVTHVIFDNKRLQEKKNMELMSKVELHSCD